MQKSAGGTDPALADDDAIKRRINSRYLHWAAQAPSIGGIEGLQGIYDFTIAANEFSEPAPSDFLAPWQLYFKHNTGLIPVQIISAKKEHLFQPRRSVRNPQVSQLPSVKARFLNKTITFIGAEENVVNVQGDYELRYYAEPDELSDDTDETVWPAPLDEILIKDVVAQLQTDGRKIQLASVLNAEVEACWKEFRKVHHLPQKIRNARITDLAGYREWGNPGRF